MMTQLKQVGPYFALMLATWLIWSGQTKPLLIFFGVVSCALVTLLLLRMDSALPRERFWLRLLPRLPRFWLWLGGEIVKSNLHVAAAILSPTLKIQPRVVTIRAEAPDEFGQALLGNSITLTPGTVTLDDHEGELVVHCLTDATAKDLEAGGMNRRIAALTRF